MSDPSPSRDVLRDRRQGLLAGLGALLLVNAVVAELVGGKLFQVQALGVTWTLSSGVLLWPIVFVASDLVNEYFGRIGVRRLSLMTAGAICYAYLALWLAGFTTAAPFSPISDSAYNEVFRQSRWIIVGSVLAFLTAQFIDVTVFWMLRNRTGGRFLWLRATGSTVVSQFVDTIIVGFIGLHLPWILYGPGNGVDFQTFASTAASGYVIKFTTAILVTPFLYVGHALADRFLGDKTARDLVEATAATEVPHDS